MAKQSPAAAPEWLTCDFLTTCLREEEEEEGDASLTVQSVETSPMTAAGEVPGSRVLRARAVVLRPGAEPQTRRLVLKLPPDGEQQQAAFRREAFAYARALPAAQAAQRAAEGAAFRPLAARCLRADAGALLLDDPAARGFRPVAPGASLDLPHCSLVARAAARLHAATATLVDQQPYAGQLSTDSSFFNDATRADMQRFTEKNMLALAESLEAMPGFAGYAQKYRQLAVKIFDRLLTLHQQQEGHFRVLLHGDLWRNNLMFRYSDGQPVEVRLLDFQMSYVGSPAQDLQFFLYGSASEAVHRHSVDALLTEYHGQLEATLRALGRPALADAYPLSRLRADMDGHALLGLYCACNAMGFTLAPAGPAPEAAVRRRVFANPALLSYIRHVTPLFEAKGLL